MEQKTEASQAVKFRKKPVEIEAIQWTGKLQCLDAFNIPELHQSLGSPNVGIPTLEGTMIAHMGDWIIKGVKGEFYPCKDEIFKLTYERAALKAQPAPTDPVAWMCPNDPDSASAFIWARKGVDYSNMSCDSCGGKHVPVYRQPAPTEAAQGSFLVRVTPMNPEYADVHPELALEDALRVIPYGWPDGFQFEVVAAQPDRHALQAEGKHPAPCARHCEATAFGIEIRRLTAENSQLRATEQVHAPAERMAECKSFLATLPAQGEDSARLDAERYRYFRRIYGAEARLIRGPIFIAETPEQFDAGIDECIRYEQEVARASAETGGVKP